MIKKTDTCAHCGAPIGPAHLYVSKGTTEGPAGLFCLPTRCFELAWQAMAAGKRDAAPGASQGVSGGDGA